LIMGAFFSAFALLTAPLFCVDCGLWPSESILLLKELGDSILPFISCPFYPDFCGLNWMPRLVSLFW